MEVDYPIKAISFIGVYDVPIRHSLPPSLHSSSFGSDPSSSLLFSFITSTPLFDALLYYTLIYSTLLCSNHTILYPFNYTAAVADEMKELERQLAEKKTKFEDLLVELEIVNEKYAV